MSPRPNDHPLRLLFFESVPDFGGGSERVSHDLAIALSRSGHRVFFAVPREGTALDSLRQAGVRCIVADIGPLPASQPALFLRRWFAAASLALEINPDHTFTSVGYLAPLLGSLQLALRIPSAVHLGLVFDQTPAPLRWAMRLGVLGIAPSRWTMDAWKKLRWPFARLRCVANGVNLTRFSPRSDERATLRSRFGWTDSDLVTVFIGRLTPGKGVLTLLRAFSAVHAAEPRARLVLFGQPSENTLAQLQTVAAETALPPAAWLLHGPISEPELALAAADLAIVPSEDPETFGLSVIEAMACACPVIVSDTSLLPELIGSENRRLVFHASDAVSLASVWRAQLFTSAACRLDLGRRLRERAATHFPLEKTAQGYLALFQQNGYRPPIV